MVGRFSVELERAVASHQEHARHFLEASEDELVKSTDEHASRLQRRIAVAEFDGDRSGAGEDSRHSAAVEVEALDVQADGISNGANDVRLFTFSSEGARFVGCVGVFASEGRIHREGGEVDSDEKSASEFVSTSEDEFFHPRSVIAGCDFGAARNDESVFDGR